MDAARKKELREQFKEIKTMMGVYKITNKINGKVFIGSAPNLKNKWFTLKMQLDSNRFANHGLQEDWTKLGEEAFTYEVLEEKELTPETDRKWAPKQLAKKWLEKEMPFGEKGYNKEKELE